MADPPFSFLVASFLVASELAKESVITANNWKSEIACFWVDKFFDTIGWIVNEVFFRLITANDSYLNKMTQYGCKF